MCKKDRDRDKDKDKDMDKDKDKDKDKEGRTLGAASTVCSGTLKPCKSG